MATPGTFIDMNARRRAHVVDMPASSYRPSPPSSRAPSTRERLSQEPDRLLVETPEPAKTEPTLRSAPEPPREVAEMAGKKKRSPEAIAKMKATLAAKRKAKEAAAEPAAPAFDGLDLILDIIELCERAKKGLSKSQRVRLRATLNERLS